MERSSLCYAVLEYTHSLIGAREEKREKMREKEEASLAQWNAIFRQRKRKFPINPHLRSTRTSGCRGRAPAGARGVLAFSFFLKAGRRPARSMMSGSQSPYLDSPITRCYTFKRNPHFRKYSIYWNIEEIKTHGTTRSPRDQSRRP
jgi:hypothetical protein